MPEVYVIDTATRPAACLATSHTPISLVFTMALRSPWRGLVSGRTPRSCSPR
jgi:hypothetical protein